METVPLKFDAGTDIRTAVIRAKGVAKHRNAVVEFNFNDRKCLVNAQTDPELFYRDFMNAYTMKWMVIGPDCPVEYSPDVKAELERLTQEAEVEGQRRAAEYAEKERQLRAALNEKLAGIELAVSNEELFGSYVEKNTDGYGGATINYGITWGRLMQWEISQGRTIEECAEQTSHEADVEGITGFMYGCAVGFLSRCWQHGETLRRWHNAKYNHHGVGVVNPAVLTIQPK